MKIFLSYASQDRQTARAIELGLREQGHDVFFDRDDLPAGEEFHNRIRSAIEQSHLVIFLVSPDALDAGSYTLTELEIAEKSWKHASGKLLPVILRPTPRESLPAFVRSVTFLHTEGNVVASVVAAVHRLEVNRKRRLYSNVAVAVAMTAVVALVAWKFWPGNTIVPAEITGKDGAPAVIIPAGSFTMGDDEESPRREVYVDSFYIDRFEVTTARYAQFLNATGSVRPPDDWESVNIPTHGELPVVGVDWNDADAYCAWAGKRLPTETEWEKAARGTDARRYPWGDLSPTADHANYQNASPRAYEGGLAAVGKYPAGNSPYGVSDLAGNAAEWVSDWYSESFSSGEARNPPGPDSGDRKVVRGGGRFDQSDRISPVKRYYAEPGARGEDIGFRCARNVR